MVLGLDILFSSKISTTSFNFLTGNIFIPSIIFASSRFFSDKIIFFIPIFLASMHIGNIPSTFSIVPSNDSSPMNIVSSKNLLIFSFFIFPSAIIIPVAIAKSKFEPCFFVFAGAKFTTIFLLSRSICEFFIAVFTLSFDSFTLVSGNPDHFETWHSFGNIYLY